MSNTNETKVADKEIDSSDTVTRLVQQATQEGLQMLTPVGEDVFGHPAYTRRVETTELNDPLRHGV